MSDLKGFNRVDKGSQNNLVDFSQLREGSGSLGEIDDDIAVEDDHDTIFDLTAQVKFTYCFSTIFLKLYICDV